jgi:alcohol/geraniol dehydrogenase (NADP+)
MAINAYATQAPKGRLETFTFEPGPLGRNEVEVAVTHCGICHSDLSMINNEWGMTQYPLVPGHEVIGTVAAKGADVTGLELGQRVGLGWQCGSCASCEYCHTGREQLCAQEQDTIVHHHGGFADLVRATADFVVPIPEALPSAEAAPLLCAGNTVFAPALRHHVDGTKRVAVVGIGGLGHVAVQFLAKMGCEVTAISSTHAKDEEARVFGAKHFIATKGTDELAKAANSFDYMISTVSASLPWNDYVNALRPQGTLVIVGVPDAEMQIQAFGLIGKEKEIAGGRAGSPSDIALMLDFAARNGVRAKIEKYPMEKVNEAMERLASGKARYRVVLER